MKQFLRETWELWYWALFCPSKLQRRLNEWVPKKTLLPSAVREEAEKEKSAPASQSPDTSFKDILWFRWNERPSGGRLVAQFVLLMTLSSLPLWMSTGALGGPRDLVLAGAGLVTSMGLGVFCLPLGLIVPLLLVLIYLANPVLVRSGLEQVIARLPRSGQIGKGLFVGFMIFCVTIAAAAALRRSGSIVFTRVVLFTGTCLGVATTAWLVSGNSDAMTFSGFVLTTCLTSLKPDNKAPWGISGWLSQYLALAIGIIVTGGFGIDLDFNINSTVSILAMLFAVVVAVFGFGRFVAFRADRTLSNSLTAPIVSGVAGGLLAGISTIAVSGFFAELVKGPLGLRLIACWLVGYGLAPTRAGFSKVAKLWPGSLQLGLVLKELPIARGGDGSPGWLLLGILWSAAIGASRGWLSLLGIPVLLVGYYRILPGYPLFALRSLAQSSLTSGASPMVLIGRLRTLPPYENELLYLPLPGHDRILSAAFRADPAATLAGVQQMQESPASGLPYTFIKALPDIKSASKNLGARERSRLVIKQLRSVQSIVDIVDRTAPVTLALFVLVPEFYHAQYEARPDQLVVENVSHDIAKLVPALWDIAQKVVAALQQELPFQRERGLESCLAALDRVQDQIPELGLDAELESGWRDVLDHWRVELGEAFDTQLVLAKSEEIVQPFQSGNPLRADRIHLFKGRTDLTGDLVRRVHDQSRPTLILHGPRRCGKSSFLLNLSRLLPEDLVPVYVDLQSQAMTSSEGDFCYGLVRATIRDLRSRGQDPPAAQRATFQSGPYPALEDWLDEVRPLLGKRRLLFCVDEFEKLGGAISRGTLTSALFDELRHLIQHRDELSFIFCGAQTLEELGPKWSSYFINASPVEMLYLKAEDARELLTNPDPDFDLRYEPEIIERVLETTSCQPYLLQLIGEAMVKVANRHQCRLIDQALLDEALEEALTAGEIYFSNIWDETTGVTPEEAAAGRELLQTLAQDRAILPLSEPASAALRRLKRYHVVAESDGYRIAVPFVARWLRERKGDMAQHTVSVSEIPTTDGGS